MKHLKGIYGLRRRSVAIVLIGCLVASSLLVFAGCNSGNKKRIRRSHDDDDEEEIVTETVETTTVETTLETTAATTEVTTAATTTEPVITEPERAVTGKFDIERNLVCTHRGFSEGLCWVEYKANDKEKLGVMNKDGELIYSIGVHDISKRIDQEFNYRVCCTDFENGHSVIFPKGSYGDISNAGFIIIDSEGNEVLVKDNSDAAEKWYYLGTYNGEFLVAHYRADFSHSGINIEVIDATGSVIADDIYEYTCNGAPSECGLARDMGEGIFELSLYGSSYYINMNEYTYLYPDGRRLETSLYNGTAYMTGKVECVTLDDLKNQESLDAYLSEATDMTDGYGFAQRVGGGYFWCSGPQGEGFYSYDRSVFIEIPAVSDEVYFKYCGHFSGGYAPVYYLGADNQTYFTLLKEDGTFAFDPLICQDPGFWDSHYDPDSWNGYTPVWMSDDYSYSIVTPEGKILDPGVDDLSCIGNDAKIKDCYSGSPIDLDNSYIVSDGFFNTDYLNKSVFSDGDSAESAYCSGSFAYVNLAGRKKITEVTEYEDLNKIFIYHTRVNNMQDDFETNMKKLDKEDERVYHFKVGGLYMDETIPIYYKSTLSDGTVTEGKFDTPVSGDSDLYVYWTFDDPANVTVTSETFSVYRSDTDELLGTMYVEFN